MRLFLRVMQQRINKKNGKKALTIFYWPTYSPELNIIEIWWRFIKYEWLNIDAYESWKSLVKAVEDVLRDLGKKSKINFA